jgi:hypothetical protein
VIINPESVQNKYACNKILANYLIYEKGLPLLSVSGNIFYFTMNEELEEILKNLPIWLEILRHF